MGFLSWIWSESRSAIWNAIILILLFIMGMILVLFVSGLFGIFWAALMDWLGYTGTTVSDALSYYGDFSTLTTWLDNWIGWVVKYVRSVIDWLWRVLTGQGSTQDYITAGGAAAGATAGAYVVGGGSSSSTSSGATISSS